MNNDLLGIDVDVKFPKSTQNFIIEQRMAVQAALEESKKTATYFLLFASAVLIVYGFIRRK